MAANTTMENYKKHFNENHDSAIKFYLDAFLKDPKAFSEWTMVGNKGANFSFFTDEEIWFPKKESVAVFGKNELIGKKEYPLLYVSAFSARRGNGVVDIPISIFRRVPYLPAELEFLAKDNLFGSSLTKMPDLQRILMILDIIGQRHFYACPTIGLHQNGWNDTANKPIYDSDQMEEKDRVPLKAWKYLPEIPIGEEKRDKLLKYSLLIPGTSSTEV
jgi:hypothetical protein